jgi:predicted ATPase
VGGILRRTSLRRERRPNILAIASVIGRDFSLNILETVSETLRERLIELLDEANTLEPVHEVRGAAGRYNFRHALIREALYDALPAAKRRRLHSRVAEAIRGLNASREPYAEIAYHYCHGASPGDADSAIEYSRQAAKTAAKQLALRRRRLISTMRSKRSHSSAPGTIPSKRSLFARSATVSWSSFQA